MTFFLFHNISQYPTELWGNVSCMYVSSLHGCLFPLAGLWILILLPWKERKCFLKSLCVPFPPQKSEQKFGIHTKFNIFLQKDPHYTEAVCPCNAVQRTAACTVLCQPSCDTHTCTHSHEWTGMHSDFYCQFCLPQKEIIFFIPWVKWMELQLLDSSKN